MQVSRPRSPGLPAAVLSAVAAGCLVWLACASSRQVIEAEGSSSLTVTATQGLTFEATGPMTFPSHWPAIGGMSLAPGETIDVDLDAGESVTLKDRVRINGETVIVSSIENDAAQPRGAGSPHRLAPAAAPTPKPAPLQWLELDATVDPGSTYTWTVPSLFGDEEAVVAVTGAVTAHADTDAMTADDDGTWTLDPAKLHAFTYRVDGPAAVWQAPLDTPYGRIEGTGTIATKGGMTLEFTGDLTAVSASAVEGWTDEGGTPWDFGYSGAFPVRLDAGGGVAVGGTTVWGGVDSRDAG